MLNIPQSTAWNAPLQAYLSTDHISPATGKTIAITISKNGAAYGNPSGGATNATEIASGSYYVGLTTTDTGTLGPLFVLGTSTGVDNVVLILNVVSATTGGATNLDAAVSSRMATYTQPTGFLAATFPSGTVANTTNITAGTITTATNLTNAPTAGDFTATMKTSLNNATPTVTVGTIAAAASNFKKNQALANFEFIMTDATTHAPKTGLTVTSTHSIDGAAFASTTNSATEVGVGVYVINLSAADLNGNCITFRFTATGADDKLVTVVTQP